MRQADLTDCGLPGLRRIPYGVHMCHFHRAGAGLVSTLAPYLAAGLRSNERCLCIVHDGQAAHELLRQLRRIGIDAEAEVKRGALRIRDDAGWQSAKRISAGEAVDRWLEAERRALASGYEGLRIAGNTTFVPQDEWDRHVEYEAVFNQRLWAQRIVTLCTYDLAHIPPSGMLDIIRNHTCTLDHPDEGWQIVTA